jgi:hypothetical protein
MFLREECKEEEEEEKIHVYVGFFPHYTRVFVVAVPSISYRPRAKILSSTLMLASIAARSLVLASIIAPSLVAVAA